MRFGAAPTLGDKDQVGIAGRAADEKDKAILVGQRGRLHQQRHQFVAFARMGRDGGMETVFDRHLVFLSVRPEHQRSSAGTHEQL